MVDFIHNTFNGGEITPLLYSRYDLQKYFSSCELLENFAVIPQGGITRRPGSYFAAEVKDSSKKVRIVPFVYSQDQAYILEFGDLYLRFYKDHEQIELTGATYEIATPYGEDDLAGLKFQGSSDVVYITHPDYPVQKLTRFSDNSWTLGEVTFSRGPFKKENDTEITITPTITANNFTANTAYTKNTCVKDGNNIFTCKNNHTSALTFDLDYANGYWRDGIGANIAISLVASNNIFNNNHINSYWQISHRKDMGHYSGTASGSAFTSNPIECKGNWEFKTHRSWYGNVSIQRSYDNGVTYNNYYTYNSYADLNILTTGKESEDNAFYRISGNVGNDISWEFNVLNWVNKGVVKITAYNNATHCNANVVNTVFSNNATKYWSEGAWSNDEGFPSGICFHEERLSFAGTEGQPVASWLSKTGDFEDMEITNVDDSALVFTLATGNQDRISWLQSHIENLILGTAGGIWKLGAMNNDNPLSATNVITRKQTTDGTYPDVVPTIINQTILFLQKHGKEIRDLTYHFDLTGYDTTAISLLFEHIAGEGVLDMVYQNVPLGILWGFTQEGNLFGITFEDEQKVLAAHRHPTDGLVEGIAVIPYEDNDELWMVVNRDNGKFIEYLKPFDWGDDVEDAFFVDCGLTFDGGDPLTITGISKAAQGVVTVDNSLTDGNKVKLLVEGMTELNGNYYTVSDRTASNFKIKDAAGTNYINTTSYGTFTSGTCQKVAKDFSGASHLADKAIDVLADGSVVGGITVDGSGNFSLADYYNIAHAGLPYTSTLKPVKFEMAMSTGVGIVQISPKKRRVHEWILNLYKTVGGKLGETVAKAETLIYKEVTGTLAVPVQPYTGEKSVLPDSHYDTGGVLYLIQDQPLPMTVRSITGRMGVYD